MVVVSREARTMGADEDPDRERHAEGGADHGPEYQATDEGQAFPVWGTTVTATPSRGRCRPRPCA
jgi:hypothetical protein